MLAEGVILYIADKILSQIIKDTWKEKIVTFFSPKQSYKTKLVEVIYQTIDEFEISHPYVKKK